MYLVYEHTLNVVGTKDIDITNMDLGKVRRNYFMLGILMSEVIQWYSYMKPGRSQKGYCYWLGL